MVTPGHRRLRKVREGDVIRITSVQRSHVRQPPGQWYVNCRITGHSRVFIVREQQDELGALAEFFALVDQAGATIATGD